MKMKVFYIESTVFDFILFFTQKSECHDRDGGTIHKNLKKLLNNELIAEIPNTKIARNLGCSADLESTCFFEVFNMQLKCCSKGNAGV